MIIHREIDLPDALGYNPRVNDAGRLRVRCDACGIMAICPGRITTKEWQKRTGWKYIHGPGWTCPRCQKTEINEVKA